MLRGYARLGKTRTTQARVRLTPQRCHVCGYERARQDFKAKGQRTVNPFCNACFRGLKTEARLLRQPSDPKHKQARRFAYKTLLRLARHRATRGKGVFCMNEQEYAQRMIRLPERIAAVLGKTYAVRGDSYVLADDEALMRIRDLLEEFDPDIIRRNEKKRLHRRER